METALASDPAAGNILAGLHDFDSLVEFHRPRIFRFLLASLRDRDSAENLTQECFLRAFKARERFRGDASVGTWLMQIAANLVRSQEANSGLKFWRRARAHADLAELENWIPDRQRTPEQLALARQQIRSIWKAAASLSVNQRTVFLLRFVEDMELLEIAAVTGMKRRNGQDPPFSSSASHPRWFGGIPMTHLTSEGVSRHLAGDSTSEQARHARECMSCADQLARVESSLLLFRNSVREWSNSMPSQDLPMPHLLVPESLSIPWFRTIFKNIRETIRPAEFPPLNVTSKPVAVPSVWGFYGGNEKTAGLSSMAIHAFVIALVLWIGSFKPVQKLAREAVTLIVPNLKPYLPNQNQHGGGGGGNRSPIDASRGKLPKIAPRQFTPPRVDPPENARLPMLPTIVADAPMPNINASNYGDPLSHLGVPSNGTGFGGGIGTGNGGGVGSSKGPGAGPGFGGGFGGGAYHIGGGVSAPMVLSKVEPEYSEEARKAKWQGTVVLQVVVDEHGLPRDLRVLRQLGLGLDQKAIDAVSKWRFKPGMKDGKPVPVLATIEVSFHLL